MAVVGIPCFSRQGGYWVTPTNVLLEDYRKFLLEWNLEPHIGQILSLGTSPYIIAHYIKETDKP